MHPESLRLVSGAADIKTSGRWEAVNVRIQALAAGPNADNGWWLMLFGSLCYQNFMEYLALKRAYENPQDCDIPIVAWHSRNLLELAVWSIYCAKSQDNARRFYEDMGRDVRDTFDAFTKWGTATAQASDWLNPIAAAKQEFAEQAKCIEGIDSIDGQYKNVRNAAKECGLLHHFDLNFKVLSKFAHPTAMRVMAPPGKDINIQIQFRDCFFGNGCLFFTGAFNALEKQLRNRNV